MNNLTVRIISACALAVVFFGGMMLSLSLRSLMVTCVLALSAWEMSRMISKRHFPGTPGAIAWLAPVFTGLYLLPWLVSAFFPIKLPCGQCSAAVIATAVITYTFIGFRRISIENMAPWIILQVSGVLMFGPWCGQVFGLFRPVPGFKGIGPFFLVVFCMMTADAGAYFTGRAVGRRKLCPSISPNKTVEGLLGGMAATAAGALLIAPMITGMGIPASLAFGLLMSLTGVCGDLFVSSVKRYTGVKDTSSLIPGHGGFLDRFDSLFFSIPFAVLFLTLAGVL